MFPPRHTLDDLLTLALLVASERDLTRAYWHNELPRRLHPDWRAQLGRSAKKRLDQLDRSRVVTRERERCDELGIRLIAYTDRDYPDPLRQLPAPPPVLFVRGPAPLSSPSLTLVGSRDASATAIRFAYELGGAVAARGARVVSGLARGIDQAALAGCVAGRGSAIAVQASGVDRASPRSGASLYRQLIRTGAVVSEMPLGWNPRREHFPRRNRILAALTPATVIVEASLRSGSLITAHRALELGRDIYAVPGSIANPQARGTNGLLRDGAHVLLEEADLDLILGPPQAESSAVSPLLKALATPLDVPQLAALLEVPIAAIREQLIELEVEGQVRRLGGGLFVATGGAKTV